MEQTQVSSRQLCTVTHYECLMKYTPSSRFLVNIDCGTNQGTALLQIETCHFGWLSDEKAVAIIKWQRRWKRRAARAVWETEHTAQRNGWLRRAVGSRLGAREAPPNTWSRRLGLLLIREGSAGQRAPRGETGDAHANPLIRPGEASASPSGNYTPHWPRIQLHTFTSWRRRSSVHQLLIGRRFAIAKRLYAT